MKIVVVDDSTLERKLLTLYLKQRNCETVEASDGMEGLQMIQTHRPDLIISDAQMPHMDGFQLLHAVRSNAVTARIPFIFYSSTYTGGREEELARSLGAAAFIVKPKEPDEFWEELSAAMERCRQLEPPLPQTAETQYLRDYSKVVAAKLEEKCRELEKANALLRESERRYRALFDNTPATMLLIDPDTADILDLNSAAVAFYGYAKNELRRMSLTDLSTLGTLELATLAAAKRGPQHLERQHRLRDGSLRDVEIYRGPLVLGNKITIFSIVHDVSQRKSLETQLRQAQKMEAVGTLSGGIAHDFNNILTVIAGFVNLAKLKLPNDVDSSITSYLDNTLAAATRATNLIKSLLVFSRKQPLQMKGVNLADVVMGMKKLMERLVREDIEISVRTPEQPLPVMADEGQIGQVLMNLASNARGAIRRGGKVAITLSRACIDQDFIAERGFGRAGDYGLLTFSDNGAGMDEETRRRIFEPFFTTKAVGEGTGLGLTTVYGIVKQHAGFIDCVSSPGKGTTFQIYLPLAARIDKKVEVPPRPVPSGGSETILLAEDDAMVRSLVRGVLQDAGYRIIEAADGAEAVTQFRENAGEVRLVLLDMIMPKKNGSQVLNEIRRISSGVKILYLSGYQMEKCNAPLITKPVSPAELLLKVREVLDEKEFRKAGCS